MRLAVLIIASIITATLAPRAFSKISAQSGCEADFEQKVGRKLSKSIPAPERGMRLRDDRIFRAAARKEKKIILVIHSNGSSTKYLGRRGFRAKPRALKDCKTRRTPPNEGLVACDPGLFPSLKLWRQTVESLRHKGYEISGRENGYVVSYEGDRFYSDYDLQGVYDGRTGKHAYSFELRAGLNERFGHKFIRHPPLDDYEDREKVGLKFPITAYLPDGSDVQLNTPEERRAFYAQHGIKTGW